MQNYFLKLLVIKEMWSWLQPFHPSNRCDNNAVSNGVIFSDLK